MHACPVVPQLQLRHCCFLEPQGSQQTRALHVLGGLLMTEGYAFHPLQSAHPLT